MHIAIVADNIADRKQAERLLGRANTALSSTIGTLFVDSYGDEASFLRTCMKYDLFLLDFDNDTEHSLAVIQTLKEKKAHGLTVVCKHAEEPFQYETAIRANYTLDKPILVASLHKLLTDAHGELQKQQSQLDLLELRTDTDTHYVSRSTLLYALAHESEHRISYHFEDGNIIESTGSMHDLLLNLGDYEEFIQKQRNLIVNKDHIKLETKKSIHLSTGETLEYSFFKRFIKLR